MGVLRRAANEFLSHRRLAVAGVSRDGAHAANLVYRRLRDEGYEVFALNPSAAEVEGDRCYHALAEIPGGVEGVVIVTPPDAAPGVVRECAQAGVPRVWLHRSFGQGSVSPEAVALCEREGISVLDGACPMMFLEPVDLGHRCIRWVLGATGKLPDADEYQA
jgi:uncharacterized protein